MTQGHRGLRQGRVTAATVGTRGPAGAHAPAGPGRPALTRVSGLGLGVAMLWFSLLVLIPLTAVVVTAAEGGWSGVLGRRSPTSRPPPPSASPSAMAFLVTAA